MTYARSILIAIDQLGNALAGGNPDCTISGRTGYYANTNTEALLLVGLIYWKTLQAIIDFTFYPLDGPEHCKQAYEKEIHNEFYELRSFRFLALFVLSLFTLGSCAIMAPLFWIIYGIKLLIKKITMS